jgi:SAM-dependent methyltransferase
VGVDHQDRFIMSDAWEECFALDEAALTLFANKGRGAPGTRPTGTARAVNGNSVRVRRVLQLTRDLSGGRDPRELRILDLGCGDGVFSIEAGGKGAEVLAVDGRDVRMSSGVDCASRHGLSRVRFEQRDVREITRESHGEFDAIYCLGILYHLDVPDAFTWLENLRAMCRGFILIDTEVAPRIADSATWRDRTYPGLRTREHEDAVAADARRANTFRSLDNTFNFLFGRDALVRLLHDIGFTSVMEVHVPLEPFKKPNRVTLAAINGRPVKLATYPWINEHSEDELEAVLRPAPVATPETKNGAAGNGVRGILKRRLKGVLRRLGYEVSRVH